MCQCIHYWRVFSSSPQKGLERMVPQFLAAVEEGHTVVQTVFPLGMFNLIFDQFPDEETKE